MVAIADPVMTLRMVRGLVGLEEYTAFRMITEPGDVVCWLEAVDEPEINFPCADAIEALPVYGLDIPDDVAEALDLRDASEARVLLVVQHWNDPERIRLSTGGPIIVNQRNGMAMQIVMGAVGSRQ